MDRTGPEQPDRTGPAANGRPDRRSSRTQLGTNDRPAVLTGPDRPPKGSRTDRSNRPTQLGTDRLAAVLTDRTDRQEGSRASQPATGAASRTLPGTGQPAAVLAAGPRT